MWARYKIPMRALTLALFVFMLGCNKDAPKPEVKTDPAPTAKVDADPMVGTVAPDFTTKAQNGTEVHLSALKGKPVVIYFYPKDETSGCNMEADGFRDAWGDLQKSDVVLVGVSGDTLDSHRAFTDNHKLPFLLVSDPEGKLAAQYGVPFKGGFAARQTIVVGADGKIAKVYRKVDPAAHAKEISSDVLVARAAK
jgi:peroxiredoxin Q/BCP